MWDYPRPPRVEPTSERVRVVLGGQSVAETTEALRVLETSHPPGYYLPRSAFAEGTLAFASGSTWCEFKGIARYLDVRAGGRRALRSAWTYADPSPEFELLRDHIALYPGRMDRVTVDEEVVRPQAGDFYGGWITDRVVGPFKGAPGTLSW